MPFFSVIIPLYNKENHIQNTVKSVLNQTFQDYEIIIVNDGSTDNSVDKIKSIKEDRIKLYLTENRGVSSARNYGIKQASANFIALLDADDTWYNNHLEELHKSILKFPHADLFCNSYEVVLSRTLIKKANYNMPKTSSPIIIKNFFKSNLFFL